MTVNRIIWQFSLFFQKLNKTRKISTKPSSQIGSLHTNLYSFVIFCMHYCTFWLIIEYVTPTNKQKIDFKHFHVPNNYMPHTFGRYFSKAIWKFEFYVIQTAHNLTSKMLVPRNLSKLCWISTLETANLKISYII